MLKGSKIELGKLDFKIHQLLTQQLGVEHTVKSLIIFQELQKQICVRKPRRQGIYTRCLAIDAFKAYNRNLCHQAEKKGNNFEAMIFDMMNSAIEEVCIDHLMDLDSNAYYKLCSPDCDDKYNKILKAIHLLQHKYDNETPEM
ncbi:hypothetical protein RclHR1_15220009 [Rhizophagus clarus]|uniref:Uncharacterized protein n=1 Tax=Rhizophagus clarus TaxID=94130 RepID=A0A2Z6R7F0_9GLOM|nr:hypothetical protein RclHR1_15220009 [Rhizophagus clarus]